MRIDFSDVRRWNTLSGKVKKLQQSGGATLWEAPPPAWRTRRITTSAWSTMSDYGVGSNDRYALFAGGSQNSYSVYYSTVLAIDQTLTLHTASQGLTQASRQIGSASGTTYTVFAGGTYSSNWSNVTSQVVVYNNSLVKTTPATLSVARAAVKGGVIGQYYVFTGGYSGKTNADAYNNSFTKVSVSVLSQSRYFHSTPI